MSGVRWFLVENACRDLEHIIMHLQAVANEVRDQTGDHPLADEVERSLNQTDKLLQRLRRLSKRASKASEYDHLGA